MILNDAQINIRVAVTPALIEGHDPTQVVNCAYTLRAGRVFAAESGEERLLGPQGRRNRLLWDIGPAETLIVMTSEVINMPDDLCASYTPLNRLARQGMMLLNAAIVEPGYQGPLSCFLLNFSSKRISIAKGEPVAKIVFHTLSAKPVQPKNQAFDDVAYAAQLARSATAYQRSFLNVAEIEDRAVKKAAEALRRSLVLGGVLVGLLLLWATMEPLISRWVWEKTGATTTSYRIEDALLRRDLQAAQDTLKLLMEQQKQQSENAVALKQIEELKHEVGALKAQMARAK